jgi:hypothetical protein
MPTEAQVVTPKQIVMSPKSLMTTDGMIGLITKQGTWGYSNLAWMARMYGVKILHENGRYSTSKAQRELEDGDVRPHDLQQI